MASTSPRVVYSWAMISTRSPSSRAVCAVMGPMQATRIRSGIGPGKASTKCRTVDELVKVTMSTFGRQAASRAGQAVQGGEVDRAARGVIDAAGYGAAFTHRTGHSIGWLGAHGDGVNIDDFETHDTRLLRPGAAFSIEPGIYLPEFGVRSEYDVLIRNGKAEITGKIQNELVLI